MGAAREHAPERRAVVGRRIIRAGSGRLGKQFRQSKQLINTTLTDFFAAIAQAKSDVLRHRQVRKQGVS